MGRSAYRNSVKQPFGSAQNPSRYEKFPKSRSRFLFWPSHPGRPRTNPKPNSAGRQPTVQGMPRFIESRAPAFGQSAPGEVVAGSSWLPGALARDTWSRKYGASDSQQLRAAPAPKVQEGHQLGESTSWDRLGTFANEPLVRLSSIQSIPPRTLIKIVAVCLRQLACRLHNEMHTMTEPDQGVHGCSISPPDAGFCSGAVGIPDQFHDRPSCFLDHVQ